MLERGAFAGLDAAMMVHPAAVEMDAMPGSAVAQFDISYRGKPAHAGAYPELGVNAADAMTVAQVAIGLLRQQTGAGDRVHGIVTQAGTGLPAVNHQPEFAAACATPAADRAVLDGATAMAWTAIDLTRAASAQSPG
ncbi:hypothetical protein [Nonomuraea aurantiaca]|uniref:hypothetical protein n=1 Tax=Nonomuraea aurantiaca TaxID=2878562 RepID=UPI001CDA28FB|nr:hypothetical protein [Nonomuraea aurantiaca]MCA2221971.1 hypothetical protein [Nonomuraea aurantiaca]